MELINNKNRCFGCAACADVCPRSAIEMKPDKRGFLYPAIYREKCIDCGLCMRVCQIDKETSLTNPKADYGYGMKNSDGIRMLSSSGGAYSAISDIVLREKGIAVGAAFDESMRVVHKCAGSAEERDRFRGSKYVQSDTSGVYRTIESLLKGGTRILFSGTPCQVSGLKAYMAQKKLPEDKLLLIDVVCHGVPSPLVWKEYVKYLEKIVGASMSFFTFRDKKDGWKGYHVKASFANGKTLENTREVNSFVVLFNRNIMLRPSCYQCPYACMERTGDITIGDFWGMDKIDPSKDDNKGISLVMLNSEKGRIFAEEHVFGNMNVQKYPIGMISQPNLLRHTKKGMFYRDFWKSFLKGDYSVVAGKYGNAGADRLIYHVRDAIAYRIERMK